MGKRTNIFEFLGKALNDKDLIEVGETLKLGDIISNKAPKRTSRPLTALTTKNALASILDTCNKREKKEKAEAKKKSSNPKKEAKPTKTKKRN